MDNIFIFLLFLSPLVFFHELGHFLFARLFGVRVEVFSIGFGPKLFKKKWGETEYAFSLIPLGGYVKMFGEDLLNKEGISEEEKAYAYNHKTKWQRFWIIFAGPLANFIMTFTLFWWLFFAGETVIQARVGMVEDNSVAAQKGFQSADAITGINNEKLYSFSDLSLLSSDISSIQVERKGKKVSIPLAMKLEEFAEFIGNDLPRQLRLPLVVNDQGEFFLISDRKEVDLTSSLSSLINSAAQEFYLIPFEGSLENEKKVEDFKLEGIEAFSNKLSFQNLRDAKLYPVELSVFSVVKNMPADKAGLKKGDIILAVDQGEILHFGDFKNYIDKTKEGESVDLSVLRNNKKISFSITPAMMGEGKARSPKVGVQSTFVLAGLKKVEREGVGFFTAIGLAGKRTYQSAKGILGMLKNLVTRSSSLNQLGGPLAIGKVATDTFYLGISAFLSLMAMFSMNLGLLNLLPIPVLDGGHIMFIFLELISGGSLSKKKMLWAQQFGFMFLMFIMFFALFNDVKRFFL